MGKLKEILRTIKSVCRKSVFKIIYTIYLWSVTSAEKRFRSSRYVEYPFVIENLSLPVNSKVLLVGCAGDPLSTILTTLGYKVFGFDIKHVTIKYPNFKFIKGDIRNTKFLSNYFDAVVAVSTIEHVGLMNTDYEGDQKALKEIRRILKPNGIFLFTAPVVTKALMTESTRYYDITSLNSLLENLMFKKDQLLC